MTDRSGRPWLPHDWFGAALPTNARIDQSSWLYSSFALLHCHSRLPEAVTIAEHSGVYIGSFFELGPTGSVAIGRYCTVVGAIIRTDRRVTIGDYAFISHDVVISDDPFAVPPDGSLPARTTSGTGATLGDDVWIGTGAVIVGPVAIGDRAIVAARAVVTADVPPDAVVAGAPARVVRQGDSAG